MSWFNIPKKDKVELIAPGLNHKDEMINGISEAIINYLKMKTTGALLLTGDWGSGKTYHLKNNVFPLIENKTEFIPIMVSLYGENDKNNIGQKVLFAFFDKKGKEANLSTGAMVKNIKNLSDGFPVLKKYVDLDKLIVGTGENVFKLLPHDKLLICFDDIERMSEKIDVNDFLGIVNDLVENKNCKVLLIANEEEIKDGITFKEKTIEKTLHFSPDISSIFDSITNSYEDSPFKEYFKANKDFILSTLIPAVKREDERELKKSYSNIRSLKFAIEHFRYSYLLLTGKKNENDDLVKQQLKSLWFFTLSISIEFRKPKNISYTNKKKLDEVISFSDINLSDLSSKNSEIEVVEIENDWTYSENFKKLYYDRFSEKYIYFPSVYDLITAGKEISEKDFFAELEERFNVEEGKIKPAYQILNTFLAKGFWTYSNIEFKEVLDKLLEFCESGELEDLVSYLNSGVYLIGFNDIVGKEKEDIEQRIQNGLGVFMSNIKLDYLVKTQLEMVEGNFNEPHLQRLITFIKEKFVEIESQNSLLEAHEFEEKFINNLDLFVEEFLPKDSSFRSPDKPLFHKFKRQTVIDSLQKWEPKEIMSLNNLLKIRYLDTSFSERLIEEIVFLENLEIAITSKNTEEKNLSNHLIQQQLLPRVIECKKRLQFYVDETKKEI
ncbi:P-loop NTPase fold protein [Flavobacterium johnsoniae]|uniref:P-loop NTPase fold protein n=1 Tax=Flavobacterium johnsoniae TaxID=986 RepID=UPI003D97FC3C